MRYADARCKVVSTGDEYIVTGADCMTGAHVEVRIPARALFAYRQGIPIQDAMPMLTDDQREFLISGISSGFDDLVNDCDD